MMNRKSNLCIYHGPGCLDGFMASWVVRLALTDNNVEFLARDYQDPPPDLELLRDRDVYIVDFSYKRDVLTQMAQVAKRVVVLDHHAGAEKELSGLDDEIKSKYGLTNLVIWFDQTRSGAGLAWDWFSMMQRRLYYYNTCKTTTCTHLHFPKVKRSMLHSFLTHSIIKNGMSLLG